MIWYKEPIDELYKLLDTSEAGLNSSEAKKRLKQYGPNEVAVRREPLWHIIIEPFRSVFVAVLGVAALVSLLGHEKLDAIIVGAIILANAVIFYTQQYATSRVLRNLKRHSLSKVAVLRAGEPTEIASANLVPGDVMVLHEGERVAADGRVVHVEGLQINEASLTGESVPVIKHASTLESTHPLYEQDNMVFQGTFVTAGTAHVLVVETGARTEFGKIAELATAETGKSPVQAKIDKLVTLMIKGVGVVAVVAFVLALIRGIPAGEALRFVLSLSVAAVPEGLPVALTVVIVLGMRRMATKRALVRSFRAIEDVGILTTIATDKTGTLTKNHLSVAETWAPTDPKGVLAIAQYTVDPDNLNDPLDQAIAESNHRKTVATPAQVYPFDITSRLSGSYHAAQQLLYLKGSPEHILSKSHLSKEAHAQAESVMHELAAKGHRVIGVATHKLAGHPPRDLSRIGEVEFVGFLGLADELRPEAAAAIRAAQKAGISVRLITGDHYETAYNIGKTLGIADDREQVITGADLPKENAALAATIQQKTIFARILPEDKFRILQALKKTEITAMTGDGVNDVPALANAHVGFAMGSGSDIAKDAAGIVLLNDNFATIIKAIREGRKIYDNIRKMLFYLLTTSLSEVVVMVGALLLGFGLPVTAIQILWINLVTDTIMAIPIGLEPEEEGLMERPPRRPDEPLFNRILLSRTVTISLVMAAISLGLVRYLEGRGYTVAAVQSVVFMALIAAQWTNAFNARSETHSSFSRLRSKNPSFWFGLALAITLQMLVMFGPLKTVFNIQPVPLATLFGATLLMMVAVLATAELHKLLSRKFVK